MVPQLFDCQRSIKWVSIHKKIIVKMIRKIINDQFVFAGHIGRKVLSKHKKLMVWGYR